MKFDVKLSVTERGKKSPEYTINSDLNGEITLKDFLEFTKKTLILTADQVLKEEQSKGFDKDPIVLVDGSASKPVIAVNPLGKLEFVARADFGDIILDAYAGLLSRSKVLTGLYKESHYVVYNGKQVATNMSSLERWLDSNPVFTNGDIVGIVNVQPYARRLELLGVTAQRQQNRREDSGRRNKKRTGTLIKLPNGAYQLTFRSMKAKYKKNVLIRFAFLTGASLGLSGSFKSGRRGKNSVGRPYLYPALILRVDERGII